MPRPVRRVTLHVKIPRDLKVWLTRQAKHERRSTANYLTGVLQIMRRWQETTGWPIFAAGQTPGASPITKTEESTDGDPGAR